MAQQNRIGLALAVAVACAAGSRALVAAGADEALKSGIYLEAAKGETRLSGNMPKMDAQVGAGAALGFGKPKMTTLISGDKGTLRAPADGTFLFVFSNQTDMRQMASDPSAMMGMMGMMDELPGHTSSPKDYALLRLVASDGGGRAWDSKKGEQVKCAVEKLGPKLFRIKPEQPLAPGEYAFAQMQQRAAAMMWDFGVDAGTPSQ
jgi:hypothetical protein